MTFPLVGRNCLVTGGSRGIGLAISQKLASLGANVCRLGRSRINLEKADLLGNNGNQTHSAIAWDVSHPDMLTDDLIGQNKALIYGNYRLSETDILVNCAGIAQSSLLLRTSPETVHSLLMTNLEGTILMTKAVLRGMMSRQKIHKNCNIISISSVLSSTPVPGTSIYAASKEAINAFTKSLAIELKSTGIRVNAISPGLVNTDMGQGFAKNLANYIPNAEKYVINSVEIADSCSELILDDKGRTGQIISVKNHIKKS